LHQSKGARDAATQVVTNFLKIDEEPSTQGQRSTEYDKLVSRLSTFHCLKPYPVLPGVPCVKGV
jgi:hypothetical protein